MKTNIYMLKNTFTYILMCVQGIYDNWTTLKYNIFGVFVVKKKTGSRALKFNQLFSSLPLIARKNNVTS